MTEQDVKKYVEQLDCLTYNETAIVKVFTPYFMSVSRNSSVEILRQVVYVTDDWLLLVIPKRFKIEVVRAFFENSKEILGDVVII